MRHNFIHSERIRLCWICSRPTWTIEVNFEAPLCEGCEWIADQRYWATEIADHITYTDGVLFL